LAETRYHVIELPDAVPAQYLTNDGRILGLDWMTVTALMRIVETIGNFSIRIKARAIAPMRIEEII